MRFILKRSSALYVLYMDANTIFLHLYKKFDYEMQPAMMLLSAVTSSVERQPYSWFEAMKGKFTSSMYIYKYQLRKRYATMLLSAVIETIGHQSFVYFQLRDWKLLRGF